MVKSELIGKIRLGSTDESVHAFRIVTCLVIRRFQRQKSDAGTPHASAAGDEEEICCHYQKHPTISTYMVVDSYRMSQWKKIPRHFEKDHSKVGKYGFRSCG